MKNPDRREVRTDFVGRYPFGAIAMEMVAEFMREQPSDVAGGLARAQFDLSRGAVVSAANP